LCTQIPFHAINSYDARTSPPSASRDSANSSQHTSLFSRPFPPERKSTLLFSIACARFCRNGGAATVSRCPRRSLTWRPQRRTKSGKISRRSPYGCRPQLQPAGKTGSNPSKMNTYAKCAANPCGMRTYKIIGLKVSWNEHLQKTGGGVGSYCYPRVWAVLAARRKRRVWAVLAARANNCHPRDANSTASRPAPMLDTPEGSVYPPWQQKSAFAGEARRVRTVLATRAN
jgi:hypothetical protein